MKSSLTAVAKASAFAGLLGGCIFVYDGGIDNAEGFYAGRTSDGYDLTSIVLENDQYWAVYSVGGAGDFNPRGLVQGSGQSSPGGYDVRNLKDFSHTGAIASGVLHANYSGMNWFYGNANAGNDFYTFSLATPSVEVYDYRLPANLAAIAGSWNSIELGGASGQLQISGDGTLAGSASGCTYSGRVTPRPSGRNVFNLVISYGAAPCRLANRSASGIALSYRIPDGRRRLLAMAVTEIRDFGTVITAAR